MKVPMQLINRASNSLGVSVFGNKTGGGYLVLGGVHVQMQAKLDSVVKDVIKASGEAHESACTLVYVGPQPVLFYPVSGIPVINAWRILESVRMLKMPQTPVMQSYEHCRPTVLYTEFVQTQSVCASVPLHHTKLVEFLLASCRLTTDIPLLSAHDLVEAIGGTVRPSSTPLRCARYRERFCVGR